MQGALKSTAERRRTLFVRRARRFEAQRRRWAFFNGLLAALKELYFPLMLLRRRPRFERPQIPVLPRLGIDAPRIEPIFP